MSTIQRFINSHLELYVFQVHTRQMELLPLYSAAFPTKAINISDKLASVLCLRILTTNADERL